MLMLIFAGLLWSFTTSLIKVSEATLKRKSPCTSDARAVQPL